MRISKAKNALFERIRAAKRIPPGDAFVVVEEVGSGELIVARERDLTPPPPAGYLRFRTEAGADYHRSRMAAKGAK